MTTWRDIHQKWFIEANNDEYKNVVGKGTHGTVFGNEKNKYAKKVCSDVDFCRIEKANLYRLCKVLKPETIEKYTLLICDDNRINKPLDHIYFRYCGINLREFLYKYKTTDTTSVFNDVYMACFSFLSELHNIDYNIQNRTHFYHGDIKLENILICKKNDVRIIDFECIPGGGKIFCGTPFYSPVWFASLLEHSFKRKGDLDETRVEYNEKNFASYFNNFFKTEMKTIIDEVRDKSEQNKQMDDLSKNPIYFQANHIFKFDVPTKAMNTINYIYNHGGVEQGRLQYQYEDKFALGLCLLYICHTNKLHKILPHETIIINALFENKSWTDIHSSFTVKDKPKPHPILASKSTSARKIDINSVLD